MGLREAGEAGSPQWDKMDYIYFRQSQLIHQGIHVLCVKVMCVEKMCAYHRTVGQGRHSRTLKKALL